MGVFNSRVTHNTYGDLHTQLEQLRDNVSFLTQRVASLEAQLAPISLETTDACKPPLTQVEWDDSYLQVPVRDILFKLSHNLLWSKGKAGHIVTTKEAKKEDK